MADISFAVVGLASRLFVAVMATCDFISTAQGLASDAPIVYWKLRVEAARLRAFGAFWGLAAGGPSTLDAQGELRDIVCGIFRQMEDLFKDVDGMSKKYGFEKLSLADGIDTPESSHSAHKMPNPRWISKLKWAFKDKTKAERLAKDIRELNDGLHALLRIAEFRAVDFVAQSELLRASAAAGASYSLESAVVEDLSPSGVYRIDDSRRQLSLGANVQRLIEDQGAQIVPPPGTIVQPTSGNLLRTSPDRVSQYVRDTESSVRTLACYCAQGDPPSRVLNETVVIEWKDVDKANPFAALIAKRVDGLATFLSANVTKPAEFRILDCVGYFEDIPHSRYGFLYHLPPNVAASTPVTLYDLLARDGSYVLPELGDRFVLAQAISQSILRLHDCGWVHAGLRSSNILIFKTSTHPSCLMLTSPYVGGLNYSRPTDPAESTLEYSRPSGEHDIYRHPDVLRSNPFLPVSRKYIRYRQRHDLFSLGIILLEIGLWDQAKALKKPRYTPEKFLEKLITAYVPLLGHKMGAVYRDVVQALLVDTGTNIHNHEPASSIHAWNLGTQNPAQEEFDDASQYQRADDEIHEQNVDLLYGDNAYWASLVARLMKCQA